MSNDLLPDNLLPNDLLSNDLPEDAEAVAPAATGDGSGGDEDIALPPEGEDGMQEAQGRPVAGVEEDADGESGGGDREQRSGGGEGHDGAESGGSSPEDVDGSVPDNSAAEVVEEKAMEEAEKGGEEGEKEGLSAQGPEEETPTAAGDTESCVLSGSAHGGGTVDGGETGERQEEEDGPVGQEVEHGEEAAAVEEAGPESVDEVVEDDDKRVSAGLDNLEHGAEPEEGAGVEEEDEDDGEEEENVFGPGPPEEMLAEESTVAEAFVEGGEGGGEEEEYNVFGSPPPVQVPVEEPAAAEAFADRGEEEEEEDNVFGSPPPVQVPAGESAVAEAFAEGEGEEQEEEDDVFGLTEPSEAVLGAKAAAREAFQGGRGHGEEEGGVVSGPPPTGQASVVSPGTAPGPTESFTEEEHEDGEEGNVFGPSGNPEIPLVAEPAAADLSSKDEEEVLAVTTAEEAEEGIDARNGEAFSVQHAQEAAAAAAATTEGGVEVLASDSDAAAVVVGGRDAALFAESGASDAEAMGDGGPSLEAQEQSAGVGEDVTAGGPRDAGSTEGAASSAREETGVPDSAAELGAALGEGDDGRDTRPDHGSGKGTAEEDADDGVARAANGGAGVGGGAEGGALPSEGGGGGGGGEGALGGGKPVQTEESPEGGSGQSEGKAFSGEGAEEGREGGHEDTATEDGEDDVVFLQVRRAHFVFLLFACASCDSFLSLVVSLSAPVCFPSLYLVL